MEERQIVILLGKEKIFILIEDLKEVKLEFEYKAITKIYLHSNHPNAIMICLDKSKIEFDKKYNGFHIFVKNRLLFVKSIICYHSIYNMEKNGDVNELLLKEKPFFLDRREASLLNKGLEMIHNDPEGFKKVSTQGAE
jgi:hypothetical protein